MDNMMLTNEDLNHLKADLIHLFPDTIFDIRRRKTEVDTNIGGVGITSTAIETRNMDIQHLRGEEVLGQGGLRIEAAYKVFCQKDADIREGDYITHDSGTTRYEVVFVQGLWADHLKFFAKKVS